MTDEHIQKILARVGEKEVNADAHREVLRRSLINVHAQRRGFSITQFIDSFSLMTRAAVPVGAIAALILIVSIGAGTTQSSFAEAQEVAERAMARAIAIPPEMRAALEAQMKADMLETLKEAYAAPDLRILTKEEYEQEAQFTIATPEGGAKGMTARFIASDEDVVVGDAPAAFGFVSAGAVQVEGEPVEDGTFEKAIEVKGDATWSAGQMVHDLPEFKAPVKYLLYTSPAGAKVVLGLDENDTPVFLIQEIRMEDTVRGPNGEIGVKAIKSVELKHINLEQ